MNIQKFAAFSAGSDGAEGGNPAGIVLLDAWPTKAQMQQVAAEVGFSETAFAVRDGEGPAPGWRVRYFAPEAEIPFCGHATIALGAALAARHGDGRFALKLNQGEISVEGRAGTTLWAALQSPQTRSESVEPAALKAAMALFDIQEGDLDARLQPAIVNAGANHILLLLNNRERLAAMRYDFAAGQQLAREQGWVTMMLAFAERENLFHVRNAFAYGGVYEDPATGAAAAALGGYLRDAGWPHQELVNICQGDDMNMSCRLQANISPAKGASIRVSGTVRRLN